MQSEFKSEKLYKTESRNNLEKSKLWKFHRTFRINSVCSRSEKEIVISCEEVLNSTTFIYNHHIFHNFDHFFCYFNIKKFSLHQLIKFTIFTVRLFSEVVVVNKLAFIIHRRRRKSWIMINFVRESSESFTMIDHLNWGFNKRHFSWIKKVIKLLIKRCKLE